MWWCKMVVNEGFLHDCFEVCYYFYYIMIPSFPLPNSLLIAADLVDILHPTLELQMRKSVGKDSSLISICLFVLLVILLPTALSHLIQLEVILTGDGFYYPVTSCYEP